MSEKLKSLLSEAGRALSEGRLHDAAAMLNLAQKEDASNPRIYVHGGQLGRRAGNRRPVMGFFAGQWRFLPGGRLPIPSSAMGSCELAGRPAEALAAYRQAYALARTME
jgi:hypothetical protein